MKINTLLFFMSFMAVFQLQAQEERIDFKQFYDQHQVKGTFVLYDQKNDRYLYYNKEESNKEFLPASTFKICNSLIALETGVIKDEYEVLKWDQQQRRVPEWNADTDMKQAFKNSTVWFYQHLAEKIGAEKMEYWLQKLKYGNEDISGGINGFWLWGGLRITALQQIDFLRRLQGNTLPVSQRSMDKVKEIMISSNKEGRVLRAKTGAAKQDGLYLGWHVGYVTTKDNVYYFANCIQSANRAEGFEAARTQISFQILEQLNILKK
ncbi:class D beta-lactamase [Pedobacter gandavensis]|uniref:class D beta-lactamase n=1 Tax=Pedobacter gandavensis TaxID=2679963 RepID=UPI002930E4B9|nr:class D beta-lactamase [Pedobacter gandavensis]